MADKVQSGEGTNGSQTEITSLKDPAQYSLPPEIQENIDFWFRKDTRSGGFPSHPESKEVEDLMTAAKELHRDGSFDLAFSAYGRVLAVQLADGTLYNSYKVSRTIGHIIQLLFDQHPELMNSKEAKLGPHSCQEAAFDKLLNGEKTWELPQLLALRAIADWEANYHNRRVHADELYTQIFNFMKPLVGMKHIEVYRLLPKWSSVVRLANRDPDKEKKLSELLAVALEDFVGISNRISPEAVELGQELGRIYCSQRRYPEAELVYKNMYEEHLDGFGPAHTNERTLLFLSLLAKVHIDQGRIEEAGRLIWNVPEEGEYPFLSQARTEHYDRSNKLATWGAPLSFRWESRALYCLPIRKVILEAVFPSDSEKNKVWHPRVLYAEVGDSRRSYHDLHYRIEVIGEQLIDIIVPYIPYSHYLKSLDCQSGYLYGYYMRTGDDYFYTDGGVLPLSTLLDNNLLDNDFTEVPKPIVSIKSESTCSPGFFNNVPCDTALITKGFGYNMVSSAWKDYSRFTVHRISDGLYPPLNSIDGSNIKCHGYISGSWTSFDAEIRYSDITIFVVDAIFTIPGSNECHHFVFDQESLSPVRRMQLGAQEKRAFALALNPTLLEHTSPRYLSIWHKEELFGAQEELVPTYYPFAYATPRINIKWSFSVTNHHHLD